MKKINPYYQGYNNSNNRINYLKYGLTNDYGYNFNYKSNSYNEEEIIKLVRNKKD